LRDEVTLVGFGGENFAMKRLSPWVRYPIIIACAAIGLIYGIIPLAKSAIFGSIYDWISIALLLVLWAVFYFTWGKKLAERMRKSN
jgi:hypothetical protein